MSCLFPLGYNLHKVKELSSIFLAKGSWNLLMDQQVLINNNFSVNILHKISENHVGYRRLKLTTEKSIKNQYETVILNQIFCFYRLLSLKLTKCLINR